jgi:hypothetical protein
MASKGSRSMSLYDSGVDLNGFVGLGDKTEWTTVVIGGVVEVEVRRAEMCSAVFCVVPVQLAKTTRTFMVRDLGSQTEGLVVILATKGTFWPFLKKMLKNCFESQIFPLIIS